MDTEASTAESGAESTAEDDPRLMEAMREYMVALDAGQHVNRRELLARHPDIAAELSACLRGLAFVHGAAGQLTDGGQLLPVDRVRAEPGDDDCSRPAVGSAGSGFDPLAGAAPLGDFRLVREIGRGGMGVVYEAVQLSLGRRVAVKVLPMAAALDPRRLQRFRNEAQAAAGLHHTNIVPVYAVGSDRSTHFYAMQLIEGRTLAEVIRELRAADAAGRRRSAAAPRSTDGADATGLPGSGTIVPPVTALDATEELPRPPPPAAGGSSTISPSATWSGVRPADPFSTMHTGRRGEYFRTVAKLGVQAAEALDYAHNLGIIHRDIKPANLMLDGGGNLWVTDFGLAQMAGDNGLTVTGDMIGTMRYMSPEQAGGRPGHLGAGRRHRPAPDEDVSDDSGVTPTVLDPRTDVYSLGVTLYELLTLRPALPGRTRDDLMVQLAAADPKPPRAIDKAVPVELQTILAKAYAKDPADRYPSARALADDLGRFLADQPIHARPPTVWDHAAKWTRRHRSLTLSALVIATLAAGGLGITTLAVAAAKDRAQSAAFEATAEKAKAQREEAEVRRQRDRVSQAYDQARSAIDAFTDIAENDVPKNQHTAAMRKAMLARARSFYQESVNSQGGVTSTDVDPRMLQAQRRAQRLLDELVATDAGYRLRFDLRLLARPAVRSALKLTAKQATAAADLDHGPGSDDGGPGGGDRPSDVSTATPAEVDRLQKSLADLLQPAQRDRLAQISRQLRGTLAFEDPEVQGRLQLSQAQTEEIRRIGMPGGGDFRRNGEGHFYDGGRFGPGGGPPPMASGFAGAGFYGGGFDGGASSVQRVVSDVLTTRQKAEWAALTGPAFTDNTGGFGGGFFHRPRRGMDGNGGGGNGDRNDNGPPDE